MLGSYKMGIKDNLTDITDRYHFALSFYNAVNNNIEDHRDFSLLILKLNSLQELKKQFGEQTAHSALSSFVNILSASIQPQDQVYSSDLDTYAIILNEVGYEPVANIMERLKQTIAEDPLFLELHVSCKIGCADYQAADKLTLLFARAEQDLYGSEKEALNCSELLAHAL